MKKLKDGEYKKNNLPNVGPDLTSDFVNAQTDSFNKMLQSDFAKTIMQEF